MTVVQDVSVERVTLHFDLRHCPPEAEPTLCVLGVDYRLARHTPATRRDHAARNAALASLSPERAAELTHYAAHVALPAEAIGLYRVVYASPSPAPLPQIAVCFRHVPAAARRRATASWLGRADRVPAVLARFGVTALPPAAADAIVDASYLLTPFNSAQALIQSHPDLASASPDVQAVVDEWTGEALRGIGSAFVSYLSQNGPGTATPWYTQTFLTNPDGTQVTPDPSLRDKHGQPIPWPTQNGQPGVAQYALSTGVLGDGVTPGAIAPALGWVLQQTKNDSRLNGWLWTAQHGITSTRRSNVAPVASAARAADASGDYNWAFSFLTSQYGVTLDPAPPVWDADTQTISFNVYNWANRCLGVYVQFLDASGTAIANPSNWVEQLPATTRMLEPNPTKRYYTYLFAANTFYGARVMNSSTTLSFPVPPEAVKIEVLLGGLGVAPFDMDVDIPGIIGTVVLNYAIPAMLLALTVGGNFSPWIQGASKTDQTLINLVMAMVPMCAALLVDNVSAGEMLDIIGEGAIGMIVSAVAPVLEQLAKRLFAYVTGKEIAESMPVVGWAAKVAAVASTIADLLATTVEVCKSPATYKLEITRSIAVSATVSPDPTHAAPGQPAIWPDVATMWTATVLRQGGTYATQTGAMPSTNDQALQIVFPTIPAAPGESIQVVVSIYSATEWLAGQWSSPWLPAVASSGTTLSLTGSIIEALVPLTADTQYSHLQKLSYDASTGAHVWDQTTIAPSETASSTDCTSTGTLCALTGIAINDAAYAVGYGYRAGGQGLPLDTGDTPSDAQMYAFQSISVLTDPEAGMKAPTLGFSVQPAIGYDQFGPAPLFTLADTFMTELDAGGTVGADLVAAFSAAGSQDALPAAAQITVVTASAEWYLGLAGATPLYDLRRQVDSLQVFPYPTPAISPRNFYLDPRSVATTGMYYLRSIALEDGSPTFDYTPGQSFGTFQFPNSNPTAIAVHPNGYVVAVDYINNKLQILALSAAPVDDASAPAAQPASGAGSREGLVDGPRALTVTPDGRVLVLEQGNARVQAFDVVGNPAQTFAGPLQFSLAAGFQSDLDDATASTALIMAYQAAVVPPIAACALLPAGDAATLDAGSVPDDLAKVLLNIGVSLSGTLAVAVVQAGAIWLVADQTGAYDLRLASDIELRPAPALAIEVVAAGNEWLVRDTVNTLTFSIQPDTTAGDLAVQQLVATFALVDPIGAAVTYLDLAVETRSFIYVLSYADPDGGAALTPASYRLDIYNPDGSWLARTPSEAGAPGVTGACITVDQWRNLYTLNYEAFQGPSGRTEPSVSTWIPSTPDSAT